MSMMNRRSLAGLEDFPTGLRLFEDAVNRLFNEPASVRPWTPPVDIRETEDDVVLTADVPGVKMEDIDIQIENQTLTVTGERKFENEQGKGGYHRIERSYGRFNRYFSLPETVDTEKVTAELDAGVLKIRLPKKEVAKPRSIKVQLATPEK